MSLALRLCHHHFYSIAKKCLCHSVHALHTSNGCYDFWESHRKGVYGKDDRVPLRKVIPYVKEGFKGLKGEFELLKDEIRELILMDPPLVRPGDSDYVWKFDKPEVLEKWNTVSDKDHNEGFSECEFKLNKYRKAVFSGFLSTRVPKDGKIHSAGYCNITSQRVRKSFKRDSYYEWESYTHLLMRVRGDGRSYMINLLTEGSFDLTWNDMFNYVLYTRGGPYWQMVKIPFSKFFLTSKGRIQDKQSVISLNHITNIGITCSDTVSGPFQLEIDYIGILCDPTYTETFAYEMYKVPDFIAGT